MPNFAKHLNEEQVRILRNRSRKMNYLQTQLYDRRHWTLEEDRLLFNNDMTDRELSSKIHRSVEAIQIRRSRLRKD